MISKRKILAIVVFIVFLSSLNATYMVNSGKISLKGTERLTSTNTLLETDVFFESAELFAGREKSLIAQLNYVGGNYDFPFDLSAPEFEYLDAYILYSGNQRRISEYWPRALAELRDGITLMLSFTTISYSTAITHATTIRDAVNQEYSLDLNPLFGYVEQGVSTIAFYQTLAENKLNSFLADGWSGSPYSDGLNSFSSATTLQNAPAKITAHILKRVTDPEFPSGWLPVNIAGFVETDAISIDNNDTHTLSLSDVFGFTSVQGSVYSNYSLIKLRMPYVANVHHVDPLTDNLYPEITGDYQWTLRTSFSSIDWLDEHSYDDIHLVYDLNITDFTNFPQIEAIQTIDNNALTNDNILNYTISMTNKGAETANDVKFVQELGDPPEPLTTPVFDNDTYYFNDSLIVYFDTNSGAMMETVPTYEDVVNITYDGWFQYRINDSIVQPIIIELDNTTEPGNHQNINYWPDFVETFLMLHVNRTFFTFSYSDAFTPVEDISNGTTLKPNYGLEGNIASLAAGQTQDLWWSIGDLPSDEDFINVFDFKTNASNPDNKEYNDTYVVDFILNDTVTLKDYIVYDATVKGQDLRFPPGIGDLGWLGGSKFRYEDQLGREYFGLSNGIGFQLYDNEAVLVTSVDTDESIYRVGDDVNINFTIENIGDAVASDIKLTGYHAFMKPNWELGDIIEFYNTSDIEDIAPGEKVNVTWHGKANTFLGIHPVFAGVTYTTEASEGSGWNGTYTWNNVLSTLIDVVVLPPEYKEGKEEPSFPTPEVQVNTSLITDGEISVGDTLEIHTTVTNVGDESTHINIISYFGNENLKLEKNAYSGIGTVKITYANGTLLNDYEQGFVIDSELNVTYIGASNIMLKPNETIHLYYKVNTTSVGTFTIPPIVVEYDSDYPMDIPAGEDATKQEDATPMVLQSTLRLANAETRLLQDGYRPSDVPSHFLLKPMPVFSSVNTWSSASNPVEEEVNEEQLVTSSDTKLPGSSSEPAGEDTSDIGVPSFDVFMVTLALVTMPMLRFWWKKGLDD